MTKRLLTLIAVALPALAQTTVHTALVKHWKTSGDFTVAVANAMPSDGYDFSPFPAEPSFGTTLIQMAVANRNACEEASGLLPKPAIPLNLTGAAKTHIDKETVVHFLRDTFDYCNRAVASMTSEDLDSTAGRTRKMSGFEWLWSYFTHTAHHRAQLEFYLRAKGINPPDYSF